MTVLIDGLAAVVLAICSATVIGVAGIIVFWLQGRNNWIKQILQHYLESNGD